MKNLGAEHENLDQKAYLIIKGMITERKLLPGEKIPQERLAQELGISRTPIVNALKYLEKEKLVEALPRRGFFVRLFRKEEMISIFELREVLEGLAARRAAMHITDIQMKRLQRFFEHFKELKDFADYRAYAKEDRKFHDFVVEVGSREFLKSILNAYNIIAFSYQFDAAEGLVRPPRETITEHLAIIKAIMKRLPDKAEEMMRLHLRRSLSKLRAEAGSESYPGGRGQDAGLP